MKREYLRRECLDGSVTFFRPDIKEAYHHPAGAALEAREKFVGALNLAEFSSNKCLVIVDFCYGLGYNAAAVLEAVWKHNPKQHISLIGLEIDKVIVEKCRDIPFLFSHKEVFTSLLAQYDSTHKLFAFENELLEFKVLIGDAKKRVKEISTPLDIVFFDPFSPKKAPHMWTQNIFDTLYEKMATNGVLVTYSCARMVRDRMRKAGFVVQDGPVVGRRGPATIATKSS